MPHVLYARLALLFAIRVTKAMGKEDIAEFLLGAALITQPAHTVSLLAASAGLAVFRRLRRRSDGDQASNQASQASSSKACLQTPAQ